MKFLFESFICGGIGLWVLAILLNPQGRVFLLSLAAVLSFIMLLGITIRGIWWVFQKWRIRNFIKVY